MQMTFNEWTADLVERMLITFAKSATAFLQFPKLFGLTPLSKDFNVHVFVFLYIFPANCDRFAIKAQRN